MIWQLNRLQPDIKTIADFRRINRKAFKQVFQAFNLLCRQFDLFGRELLAVDGTRIKAVNSRDPNFSKAKIERALAAGEERLKRYFKQLDEADKSKKIAAPSAYLACCGHKHFRWAPDWTNHLFLWPIDENADELHTWLKNRSEVRTQ